MRLIWSRFLPDVGVTRFALVLAGVCSLWGCTASERHDAGWRTVPLSTTRMAEIDADHLVITCDSAQQVTVRSKLLAAGFQLTDGSQGTTIEVVRAPVDREAIVRDRLARDLTHLQTIVEPGAVRLVLLEGNQRSEAGDALLIDCKQVARLPELLARHNLQNPTPVVGTIVRVVTLPRGDLLSLSNRLTALRADPDIAMAELDLITVMSLKPALK